MTTWCRVDTREQKAGSLTEQYLQLANISYQCDTLHHGDYHIVSGTNIIAIIERKRLDDFITSCIDGRMRHADEFYLLKQENPSLEIIYVIEYSATDHSPNWVDVEQKKIELQIYYGFTVICTNNLEQSANLIIKLCKMYAIKIAALPAATTNITSIQDLSNRDTTKDINCKTIQMWRIPGIGDATAKKIVNKISLQELLQIPNIDQLLSKLKLNLTMNGKKSISQIYHNDTTMCKQLLSQTYGVSKNTADILLSILTLRQLTYEYTVETILAMNIKINSRLLTPKLLLGIRDILSYKSSC